MKEERAKFLEKISGSGVRAVALQFTDLFGNVKSVTIPFHALPDALEKGIWFDGSSVQGFARIHESDMLLIPDTATYQILPWEPESRKVARIICDVFTPNGKPLPMDPRHILKTQLKRAKDLGFIYNTGSEVEFFLFRDGENPVTHDTGGYFDFTQDAGHAVRMELIDVFESLGMQVEMSHHEVAPGQHEIDIRYADALTTADNVVTLKYAVGAIAQKHGLKATFMPKPIAGINGSGMHTHQSLFDEKTGRNAFYREDDEKYRLSTLAYQFIAGQLMHAGGLAAIVAPTVNSYKRLVPGYEAPVYICWARINRSALIRVPQYSPGREQSTRLELRFPDPSCNPYLAFAAMLAAGLDGVTRHKNHPEPVEEDVYHLSVEELKERGIGTLPATLAEALEKFSHNQVLQNALGPQATEAFLRLKGQEWDEYRLSVSEWEREKYF